MPDPVWVLGKWEPSANKLTQLPPESLPQARHSSASQAQGAWGLVQKLMPGAGRKKEMSGF